MENDHIWAPSWTSEMKREHFWEPLSWDRHGMGMSKIYEEDMASHYGIKGKKIKAFRAYGIEKGKAHFPLRFCIEFDDTVMTIDRAVHNMGDVRLYDTKTNEQVRIPQPSCYTAIRQDKTIEDFFGGEKFPYGCKVKNAERAVGNLAGMEVSEFIVYGNLTLAVGLLPTRVEMFVEDKLCVVMGTTRNGKKEISKALGRKCASQVDTLYVLGIQVAEIWESFIKPRPADIPYAGDRSKDTGDR
jgi:hypothetical protein